MGRRRVSSRAGRGVSSTRSRKVWMSRAGLTFTNEEPSLWQIQAQCGQGGARRLPGSPGIVGGACCVSSLLGGIEGAICQVACASPGSCSTLTKRQL